jgi:CheY-like chemotaxis protein
MSMTGLLLSDDLLFISRIEGTARDLGLRVVTVRTPAELLVRARKEAPACVIVDLANPGLMIGEVVEELREIGPRVVAYGPHVDAARLQAAREAECDVVLARSKFVERLPEHLTDWFQSRPQEGSRS